MVRSIRIAVLLSFAVVSTVDSQQEEKKDPCKSVPTEWDFRKISTTVFGDLNAKRTKGPEVDPTNGKIELQFSKLTDSFTLTRDAHKECKKICVEVFDGSGKPEGNVSTAVITTADGKQHPAGSRLWAHCKFILMTPCEEKNTSAVQIINQTLTFNGNPAGGTDGWKMDDPGTVMGTGIPGPGIGFSDCPGNLADPGQVPDAGSTLVITSEFYTFLSCGGQPIAVVHWKFTMTLTSDGRAVTCRMEAITPEIFCEGTKEYNEAKNGPLKDAEKRQKKDK